jgi:hypothetical protein
MITKTESNQKYYAKNKEILLSNAKVQVTCELCKTVVKRNCIYRHLQTKKCEMLTKLLKYEEMENKK